MKALSITMIVAVGAVLLIACGAVSPKRQDSLKEAVLLFNEGVRWGRLQDVVPRISPGHVANFMEMHKAFGKTIQISDYDILNTAANWEKKQAEVTVQITWYRNTEMELFTTILSQKWEESGTDWILGSESYVSGEPF